MALFCACEKKPAENPGAPSVASPPTTTQAAVNKVLTEPTTDPGLAEAQKIFAQRCVMCHGASGHGDGVASANLNPKPRNYTDAAWQASVKDEDLTKIIVGGGDAVGKSIMMPANPDLKDKADVVAGLVKIVRGFGSR